MSKAKYQIYESISGRKKRFLVFKWGELFMSERMKLAERFFKVTNERLVIKHGWIFRNKLYLEEPSSKAEDVIVITMINKELGRAQDWRR